MTSTTSKLSMLFGLGLVVIGNTAVRPAVGDEPRPATIAALRADYAKRERELDRKKIQDLSAIATAKNHEDSEAAYEELFGLAMARDLYQEALPAALIRREDRLAPLPSRAMAVLVSVIAKADRGDYEESLNDLARFLAENAADVKDPSKPKLDESTVIALGEAYLQRLFNARQYELAGRLGSLIQKGVARPAIQEHFKSRMARLSLLGKPAPAIKGLDVDGKVISLEQFRGKVVLVDFWAAWCGPCLQQLPELVALNEANDKAGFAILGINLDAQRSEVGSVEKAKPIVRRLLVAAQIGWPNILAAAGADDPTKEYSVTEIPANFLVGKDGNIVGFELSGNGLRAAVAEELKK